MANDSASDQGVGSSKSAAAAQAATIPRTRTRTGCKECRVRRIKCIEGRLVPSTDPSKPARRAPCSKCVKRRRQCQYPDGSDWYNAVVEDLSAVAVAAAATTDGQEMDVLPVGHATGPLGFAEPTFTLQDEPVQTIQTPQQRSKQLLSFPCLAIECPPASPAPSSRPVSPSVLEEHLANLPDFDPSFLDDADNLLVPYQPQLSQRSRISMWDSNIADDSDHLLVSYLFAGRFDMVGVYGASDPTKDHFQYHTLPRIRYALSCHNQGEDVEADLVYHAALALSGFHQAVFCAKEVMNKSTYHVRKAHSNLQLIRSSDATKTEASL